MVVFLTKLFLLLMIFLGSCTVLVSAAVLITMVSMAIGVMRSSKVFTRSEQFWILLLYSGVIAWTAWLTHIVAVWTFYCAHLAMG